MLGLLGINAFLAYFCAFVSHLRRLTHADRFAAREIKRLDNVLRSAFVAHFAESLSGLSSIRAYAEVDRFVARTEQLIDRQNSAVYLVWASQRWLGMRLDIAGSLLVLIVALIVRVVFSSSV